MFFLFLFAPIFGAAQEIRVDLNNPVYKNGSLSTHDGGIIEAGGMRIQAHSIEYIDKEDKHFLSAEGNLLIATPDKFFVGDSFTYNFITKEGLLKNGVTRIENVFMEGEKIIFRPDGTLSIVRALATTSESDPPVWSINATETTINEKTEVQAKDISLSLYNTHLLWLPKYSTVMNKNYIEEPAFTYRVFWEKKQGPLFLVRYRLLETETTSIFWRLEGRCKMDRNHYGIKGGGTALEVNYESPNKAHTLEARNFYAYDTFYNDIKEDKYKHRYRIQGLYNGHSQDEKIESFARWDVLSDRYMRSDFPTQLFELSTLERTEAFIKARYDAAFVSLYARPRVNSFTGFQQELPTLKATFKPYVLGPTSIIMENQVKLSYLDYVYASELSPFVSDFHSSRFETKQNFYRPFFLGPLSITPHLGSDVIYYGDPSHLQAVGNYGVETSLSLWKNYSEGTHLIKPYAHYLGLANTYQGSSYHSVFSVQDGFHNLNQVKLGVLNTFTSSNPLLPDLSFDLYGYHFLGTKSFTKVFPKTYSSFLLEYPSCAFTSTLGWNSEKNCFDHTNFRFGLTVNEYLALSLELRYRGPYDWRKNSPDNFILDVTHPIEDLRLSPLSDERTTFLAKWEIKIPPLWTIDIYNHVGWRPHEPFYHESKVDLYTIISNTWRLRLSYTRTVDGNAFSFGINLL